MVKRPVGGGPSRARAVVRARPVVGLARAVRGTPGRDLATVHTRGGPADHRGDQGASAPLGVGAPDYARALSLGDARASFGLGSGKMRGAESAWRSVSTRIGRAVARVSWATSRRGGWSLCVCGSPASRWGREETEGGWEIPPWYPRSPPVEPRGDLPSLPNRPCPAKTSGPAKSRSRGSSRPPRTW